MIYIKITNPEEDDVQSSTTRQEHIVSSFLEAFSRAKTIFKSEKDIPDLRWISTVPRINS